MSKIVKLSALALVILVSGFFLWGKYMSDTKIAFVNYSIVELSSVYKANENPSIKLLNVSVDKLDELKKADLAIIYTMGLRLGEEQMNQIKEYADKGLKILTMGTRKPVSQFNNLDSTQIERVAAYLEEGGKKNYKNMLNYVRKYIDVKYFRAPEPEPAESGDSYLFYHENVSDPDADAMGFNSVSEYDNYLKKNDLWSDTKRRVVITGPMGDPTDLTKELEKRGVRVYNVSSLIYAIRTHKIDSIMPSAIINFAHGRMGDYVVNYLKKNNISLFSPLNVNQLVEEWEADKMGMSGGFLSQSIVTPEIDGALLPYAIFGIYKDSEGMHYLKAIPDRLDNFVSTLDKYAALREKPNKDKKVVIVYYKGPGQHALIASGMEVSKSLLNVLRRLQSEGYTTGTLPSSEKELETMIQKQGAVFNAYAEGAAEDFFKNAKPIWVDKTEFDTWFDATCPQSMKDEMIKVNGEFPGAYMADNDKLGLASIQFGNIVLMPQYPAAAGGDSFKIVHGAHKAPPYPYVAAYLWAEHKWKADALIHFGTHGSFEFTPYKQVALSSYDWSDRLIGTMPHFYIYTIGNVGESIIAKRRSYASLVSHLTPPFMESKVRTYYRSLEQAIRNYYNILEENRPENEVEKASLKVKEFTLSLGIHRDLKLDSVKTKPYTEAEISRIENFAEELANEKITGKLYTMGEPYESSRIESTVYAMATEPIAYSLLALDKQRGLVSKDFEKSAGRFTSRYIGPAKEIVKNILSNPAVATDSYVCKLAKISQSDLEYALNEDEMNMSPDDLVAMMMNASAMAVDDSEQKPMGGMSGMPSGKSAMPAGKPAMSAGNTGMPGGKPAMSGGNTGMPGGKPAMSGGKPEAGSDKGMGQRPSDMGGMDKQGSQGGGMPPAMMKMMGATDDSEPELSDEMVNAIVGLYRAVTNVNNYRNSLIHSPGYELDALVNALGGGYTAPSPGGDPVAHPNSIPTGRNMFSINAEATPTEASWERGVRLAEQTLENYKKAHNDSLPKKVSYTFWSGEFIESEGATIAQVLYMLGVEPVRDALGRVVDIRLIPSEELKRPRIDVVVQTSGQFRDLAASRLFLINRAVEMAAKADDKEFPNMVRNGVVETERRLVEGGVSPKQAREMSTYRVFGGINGNYGTSIQSMVESGDMWEDRSEIAQTYLNNMGAFYGKEGEWEGFYDKLFSAALSGTDAIVQPRQSNTWGALSLDHVYEFMGGLSLAVEEVTGKTPEAYFTDYRNHNNFRMQDLKEAIGVESRTTILNPEYIKEKMKGGSTTTENFSEIIRNTYSWNVMREQAIDDELWNQIFDVYVEDKFNLGVKDFFEKNGQAALQEMSAIMLETIRKGMWKASDYQTKKLAELHTELISKYDPACSGFICDNQKLQDFVASKVSDKTASEYRQKINDIVEADKDGIVMKKEEMNSGKTMVNTISSVAIITFVVLVLIVGFVYIRKRRV